jgi:hypothetical protein
MPEAPPPARAKFLTHLAATIVGAAAFVLAGLGISALLPFPEVPAIAPKYLHLAAHGDAYDVLFIGSSRFYHQIIPREFDDAVEKLTGRRPRSFNAAYDAVWPPESFYLLRKLLALRPAKLRWVVIDAMDINPQLDERNRTTRRQAYWHDWRHTRMALEWIFESAALEPDRKRELARDHLLIFFKETVSLGRGAEWVKERLDVQRQKRPRPPEWAGAEGYHPGGTQGITGEARVTYLRAVDRLRRVLRPATPAAAFSRALAGIVAAVRRAGAEPIFVIAPSLNERENLVAIPGGAALIPLNDPQAYPLLFDPDLHYDGWHLNERGAHDFTRILAEQFAAKTALPGK